MNVAHPQLSIAERFSAAQTLPEFIDGAKEHAPLWKAIWTRAHSANIAPELLERASEVHPPRNILVLLEDWCGDALNSVPAMDAFVAHVPNFSLRVVSRDANDDLMQAHLSPHGKRAIPVAIVYDEQFRELGWWGSRPSELQRWLHSPHTVALTKSERYALVRRWYVQDRGVSTLSELLNVLELK